jgi:pyruvate dehydrogenase E2 component (dihydrolipoamide acetyltransferase)
MDEALRYLEAFRAKTGRRLTLTHMMARAVAGVLAEMPDANAVLRFNRIYLRKEVAVFFQVAMKDDQTGEIDLSGTTVREADKKSLLQLLDDFERTVDKVRKKQDKELEGTRSTFKAIPFFLLNTVLDALAFLAYDLNLDLRWAGVPKDPFGSVMVTNVGSLGLEAAYVPLVPYSHVPLLIAMGAVQQEAVVVDGDVSVATVMRVYATFDHRILDGSHAAIMSRTLKAWFERPFEHFDRIEDLPEAPR